MPYRHIVCHPEIDTLSTLHLGGTRGGGWSVTKNYKKCFHTINFIRQAEKINGIIC